MKVENAFVVRRVRVRRRRIIIPAPNRFPDNAASGRGLGGNRNGPTLVFTFGWHGRNRVRFGVVTLHVARGRGVNNLGNRGRSGAGNIHNLRDRGGCGGSSRRLGRRRSCLGRGRGFDCRGRCLGRGFRRGFRRGFFGSSDDDFLNCRGSLIVARVRLCSEAHGLRLAFTQVATSSLALVTSFVSAGSRASGAIWLRTRRYFSNEPFVPNKTRPLLREVQENKDRNGTGHQPDQKGVVVHLVVLHRKKTQRIDYIDLFAGMSRREQKTGRSTNVFH